MTAQDRLHTVTACLEAVGDLMNPERDLHAVNRDKLAILLSFLTEELRAAGNDLAEGQRGKSGCSALHTV